MNYKIWKDLNDLIYQKNSLSEDTQKANSNLTDFIAFGYLRKALQINEDLKECYKTLQSLSAAADELYQTATKIKSLQGSDSKKILATIPELNRMIGKAQSYSANVRSIEKGLRAANDLQKHIDSVESFIKKLSKEAKA